MKKNYRLLQPKDELQKAAPEIRLVPAARYAAAPSSDDSDADMSAVIRTLLRRRKWIYGCTLGMLAIAVLVCVFMTPRYTAVSQMQLLKQAPGASSVGDPNAATSAGFGDALDFNLTLQTQVTALKSDTLALQVIKELKLADTKEFLYHPPLIKSDAVRSQMDMPFDLSPIKRAAVIKRFLSSLKVDSVSGTRMIKVSYTHPDPAMAAMIVNHLLTDFVEHNFQVRYDATQKATDFLRQQLVDLKAQVEQSEARAVELEKKSGILGQDEHHNIVISRLEQLNNEATSAETTRMTKEAVYRLARDGNPELIAGLLGNSGTSTETTSSIALLNNLRQQEANLTVQIADASSKYGPAYPKLIQLNDQLEAVRASLRKEVVKVADRAKSEYELAASKEAAAKKALGQQKATASEMNNKAIDYTIAKQEADSNRTLYENLLRRLKEAGVMAGLRSSELSVIDPAVVPGRPSKPNIPLYLGFGLLSGLTLGVVCAFVADSMDRTVRDPEEIEMATNISVLGVIPQAELLAGEHSFFKANVWNRLTGSVPENGSRMVKPDNSILAEAFRAVRTSLLLSSGDTPAQVIMFTSSLPQEGKSFSTMNLAAVLAQHGGKVLLVDADLRRGTLSRVLKRCSGPGLSHVLLGGATIGAYRRIEEVPGLTFLPAGARPDHPSELLGSEHMAELIKTWRQEYTYILIDTPPVLPVTDAVILSPNVDGVVVVVRFGVTNRQSMLRTVRVLKDAGAECLGLVVNGMDVRSPDFYHYTGSYGYAAYDYGSTDRPLTPASATPNPKGETA